MQRVAACLSLCTALSQTPEDCIATFDTAMPFAFISVPVGTVCIECIIGGSPATGASFLLDNDSDKAVTVDGVLIIFNTSNVFHPSVTTNVRCTDGSTPVQIFVILDGMYNYQQHSSTLHLLNCGKLSFYT